jgi:peptidoglycan/xylan/chitin deacetylase (PgdA/CDA1 family)
VTARQVALTVDAEHPDRPTRVGVIERILECLGARAVPATFFVQGRWAQAEPDAVRATAAGGHLVGNHGHSHVSMPLLSAAGIAAEIGRAQHAIHDACGVDPRPWFRCPFGHGQGDARLLRHLGQAGYGPPVGWDIDTLDWDAPDAAAVEARVAAGIDGARMTRTSSAGTIVVLLHSWPGATADALPGIIDRVQDTGMKFVRLDARGAWPERDGG